MSPRNRRGKRQSGGMTEVGDDRNLPVLRGQLYSGVHKSERTGGIKETERVWIISNHDSDGIYRSALIRVQATDSIQLSKTVGTYSEGNLFVVYEIKRQVLDVSSCLYFLTGETYFPTAPSPTTTHLMVCIVDYDCGISLCHRASTSRNVAGAR
jgi:hypothetical protein